MSLDRNGVVETCTCRTCGEFFGITNGEKEFFISRGLDLPTHCEQHRGTNSKSVPLNMLIVLAKGIFKITIILLQFGFWAAGGGKLKIGPFPKMW